MKYRNEERNKKKKNINFILIYSLITFVSIVIFFVININNRIDIIFKVHTPIKTKGLDPERDKNRLWESTYNTICEDLKLGV